MDISKEHLKNIVSHLISLGEEADELHFWESFFDDLSDEEKTSLLQNLEEELKLLNGH